MDSLSLVEFKFSIQNYIAEKALPAEAVRLVLAEVLRDVEAKSQQEVQQALARRAEAEKEAE